MIESTWPSLMKTPRSRSIPRRRRPAFLASTRVRRSQALSHGDTTRSPCASRRPEEPHQAELQHVAREDKAEDDERADEAEE